MTTPDELEIMAGIAREAAALVLAHYQRPLQVSLKGPGDPVTNADLEANALICGRLAAAFPDASVVAEESPAAQWPRGLARTTAAGPERVFYVDPIDGTREFVAQRPEFAVMIGLAEQGRPAAGVVALPAAGLLLAGGPGLGAFYQAGAAPRAPLRVSATTELSRVRFVVSRARPPAVLRALLARLGAPPAEPCGSVGAKISRLLLAQAEAYLHTGAGIMLWDCCAPEAILLAAGGLLTDLAGTAPSYALARALGGVGLSRGVLATNGRLHPSLLAALGSSPRPPGPEPDR